MAKAEFNPDKLNERLEQLNRDQLAAMEKLLEELLKEMEEGRPLPGSLGRLAPKSAPRDD